MKESFNYNKYNNVNYFFTKNAAITKQHFKQPLKLKLTGNINKKKCLNILNHTNTNTTNKQCYNSELFQLAQRMKLLRSKSSEDVMISCSSWGNGHGDNDKQRMKVFPIGKRIGMLKEMKDNINDVLISEHGLKNNRRICLLKRSASTSSWIQPNEKGFDKEMNRMIKTIFYPHKQCNINRRNERMFYNTNSNRSNYSSCYSWSNSTNHTNSNGKCCFRNGNCLIESPKLIKHTPRYKLKVPVYKDI